MHTDVPVLAHWDIRPALPNKKSWEGYAIRWWDEKKARYELHPGRNNPAFARALLLDGLKHVRKQSYSSELIDVVTLDPMAGIATMLVEATKLGQDPALNFNLQAVGYEIWPQALGLAAQNLQPYGQWAEIRARDFKSVTFPLGPWADVIVTSPPFPNNHSPGESTEQDRMRETRGMGAGHAWSGLAEDVATAAEPGIYWGKLSLVWENAFKALKPGSRAYVITRDYVVKNETVPYTRAVAVSLEEAGFKVLGRITRELRPSGYHQKRIKHFKTKDMGVPTFIDHEDAIVAERP